MKEKEGRVRVLIRGDFNARTGRKGGEVEKVKVGKEKGKEGCRRSKDEKINGEGRKLCNFGGKQVWSILNGNIIEDEEREYTYIEAGGKSVIDYVIGDRRTREEVKRLVMESKIDSDPVIVWLERKNKREREEREGKRKKGKRKREVWIEEGRKEFARIFGNRLLGGKNVEEEWRKLKNRIKEALEKTGEKEKVREEGKERIRKVG